MDASGVPESRLDVVVVGVTDSEASEQAREWAAHVVADGGTIHLVAAVRPTVELAVAAIQIDSSGLVSERKQMVAEIERRLHGLADSLGKEVETEIHVVEDIPADAILGVVDQVGADLVVLGAHEQVFEHPKLIGRTVTDVLHGSQVPIAIVGKRHVVDRFDAGSIVVGVGSGPATEAALAWSAALAERRQAGLTLVRAVQRQSVFTPEGVLSLIAYYLDPEVANRWAREDLAEFADDIRAATDGDLDISLSAPVGRVGARLVEAGSDASMLVIGRPTRLPGAEYLTPGWMHHAIAHAPCPVVVVPVGDD